jgi:hypothetical protein
MGAQAIEDVLSLADVRPVERRLWSAFGRGELVDLRIGDPHIDDPRNADEWDDSRRVRAEVLRALLLGAVERAPGHVAGVRLMGALIEGTIDLQHCDIDCVVEIAACHFDSVLRMNESRVHTIDLSGCVLPTFIADSAQINGNLILTGCRAQSISLTLVSVTGFLAVNGGHLDSKEKEGIRLDGANVAGGVELIKLVCHGEVTLKGAHIGRLALNGAQLVNPDGKALSADYITVEGPVFCEDNFVAKGQLSFVEANIKSQFGLNGAHLVNKGKVALRADGLHLDGAMFAGEDFRAEGGIRMLGAHVTGQLSFNGAHLMNAGNIALAADRITVDGSLFCQNNFRAEGGVRLIGAQIAYQLGFRTAILNNSDAIALNCSGLGATSLWLDGCQASGEVDLTSAQVNVLVDDPNSLLDLRLDGFVYSDLQPYAQAHGSAGRLHWLEHAESEYRPQPYEQLATYYRRLGNDREARTVLVAKQRRRRTTLGRPGAAFGIALDVIVGYGYRPARAFAWLIALLVGGGIYFAVNQPPPLDPTEHPHFQPILYVAGQVIPLVNIGQSSVWNPSGASQWIAFILVIFGWILITAVVAGITRVLTRI